MIASFVMSNYGTQTGEQYESFIPCNDSDVNIGEEFIMSSDFTHRAVGRGHRN